ncbi:BZIP domain-containing protein [Caenorhabditis elegans]|uniref:BZIP domain-containing protein n=1 Tax=Caenorhabditis elegans TaxID=6239 RepID=O16213_CAEEL|nr:BZIP domain-containing protein [Caenorhabditis elegans]CCD69356.1 BZIP domain-containing protein [Caenorhabditis elegans]|eukprot:NP_504576.1 ATF (cAMP-dependent transcription factor) family [Caenorhabditis elegans]
MASCHEPSAFKSLCAHPSTLTATFDVSPYSSAFHLPIHPALLSNTHLLHLNTYNPTTYESTERLFEQNNNNSEKAESCSSRDSSHDSSSPTSTGGSSRDNVIVRNELKRKKDQVKDVAYWERRRKNNDAAKRSRDQRRMKEDEMAHRATSLERENMLLRVELDQLRAETDKLRALILTTPTTSISIPIPLQSLPLLTAQTAPASSVITTSQMYAPLPLKIPKTPSPSLLRSTVLVSNSSKT